MDLLSLPRRALRVQYRLLRLPVTTFELVAERTQAARSPEDIARKGLVENVLGLGKEIAGTLLGAADLAHEGRLQQAKASEQREAAIDETIADTKRQRAESEFFEAKAQTDHDRARTKAENAAQKARVARERTARKHSADKTTEVREEAVSRAAEARRASATAQQRRAERKRADKVAAAAAAEEDAEAAAERAEALHRARTRT